MLATKISFKEERFGTYLLVDHLGRGGMADVYKARVEGSAGFIRHVALKMILSEYARDQRFIEMLIQEAKVAAQLLHPNIVHIYNLGVIENTFYIEMEYVHGADLLFLLRTALENRPRIGMPPPLIVAYLGREIARGLSAAHDFVDQDHQPRPVIHCDVSLQNVMVGYDGRVKLIDFGIAKVLSAYHGGKAEESALHGKLEYMAPERMLKGIANAQTDIYATGVVLYAMLTGQRPFGSHTAPAGGKRAAELPLAPVLINPGVNKVLSNVILKALEPNPIARYQSAADLAYDLDAILRDARFTPESVVQWMRRYAPTAAAPGRSPSGALKAIRTSLSLPVLAARDSQQLPWEEEYIEVEIADTGPQAERVWARPPPVPQQQSAIRDSLMELQATDGFVGAAVADALSGQCWCHVGGGEALNVAQAAAHSAAVLLAVHKQGEEVEDLVVTLGRQYHIIRPLRSRPGLFLYVALERDRAILALASYALADLEKRLVLPDPMG